MIERRALALAALVLVVIACLTALRLAAIGGPLELLLQIGLVVSFAVLALTDLRVAVAIVVLELALAGASGRWTVFPGNLSGRIVIDAIVFAVALYRLAATARARARPNLGRYAIHATVVALLLPGIWIPLGILNGYRPADAWGDGNGYLFFAFTFVLAALALRGDLGWLRRWLLVACTATAVMTLLAAGLVLTGVLTTGGLRDIMFGIFDQGGSIGRPGGSLRIGLGSGLYLVVGFGLVMWELISRPRRPWPWLLLVLFGAALLISYTRAFWLAAVLVAVVVAVVALPDRRRLVLAGAGTGILLMAVTLAGFAVGFSLPDYVADRIATVFVFAEEGGNVFENEPGVVSNAIKLHQARVLLGHIGERPLIGWGFGAIAPDYRYGQSYSYELSYLALVYKTGIVGMLLFLSFPARLLIDAVRVRLARLEPALGAGRREAAVPIALLLALLAVGATNPYLVASFGLAPVVLMVAWLDPFRRQPEAGQEPAAG